MGITPQKEWAFVIKALRVIRYSTSVAVASDGDVKESLSYIDHSSWVCTQSWNLEKRSFFGRSLINQPTMCNWIDIYTRKESQGNVELRKWFSFMGTQGEGMCGHPAVKSLYRLVLLPLRQLYTTEYCFHKLIAFVLQIVITKATNYLLGLNR